MSMAVTLSDVESFHSRSWQNLDKEDKQAMLDTAERDVDNQYSARVARLPTLVGNKDDAIKRLTAHYWQQANGGEADSEGQSGTTTSYNTVTGDWSSHLSETKYGRAFRDMHLRDEQGIGIVITK